MYLCSVLSILISLDVDWMYRAHQQSPVDNINNECKNKIK